MRCLHCPVQLSNARDLNDHEELCGACTVTCGLCHTEVPRRSWIDHQAQRDAEDASATQTAQAAEDLESPAGRSEDEGHLDSTREESVLEVAPRKNHQHRKSHRST